MGDYAFYNARCGITSSETHPWWDITKLEYIGDYCFYHDSLNSGWSNNLSFPALTHIGVYAFKYTTISTIDIPLITHIPEGAFECTRLTSFSSANVTSIGKKAFAETYLETVSLSNVTTIDSEAFYKCTKLASVELPSVITIGDRAFKECIKLKSICLPEATYLGSEALNTSASNTNLLQHVDLHKVTKLHADVFGSPKRTGITKLILRNSDMVDVIISDTATELNVPLKTSGYIYVPTSLVSSYKADMYWSKYAAKFRALEDYTVDGTTTGELDETKI